MQKIAPPNPALLTCAEHKPSQIRLTWHSRAGAHLAARRRRRTAAGAGWHVPLLRRAAHSGRPALIVCLPFEGCWRLESSCRVESMDRGLSPHLSQSQRAQRSSVAFERSVQAQCSSAAFKCSVRAQRSSAAFEPSVQAQLALSLIALACGGAGADPLDGRMPAALGYWNADPARAAAVGYWNADSARTASVG